MEETIKEKAQYCLGCKVKLCQSGCPLGNDITDFIQYVKQEEYQKAYEVLCKTTVLQPICGRICPHKKQCEGSCVRAKKAEAVSIGDLEAFIGDMAIQEHYPIPKFTEEKREKRIAIIGGGPAGLSAAAYLARNGYGVTIFEKYDTLGGILQHGIPEFRLPKEIVNKTIAKILDLGIQVQYHAILGENLTITKLQTEFDAVFLSFGANISAKMGIEGEDLDGVLGGNELLEFGNHPDYTNKEVAIIGGGNVAMDTARTIKKLGAKEVRVIYRRAEKQMPAERKEIQAAKEEGIEFLFQHNIVKIVGDQNKKVEAIECIKTELIKKEGEARDVPIDIQGSNYLRQVDYIVMAVGSKADKKVVDSLEVKTSKWGTIQIDEKYQTSQKGVFAGGDLSGTRATVAWASHSGREAAKAIQTFLEQD